MKKGAISVLLVLALTLGLLAGCGGQAATTPTPEATPTPEVTPEVTPTPGDERPVVNLAMLKGPTGMGSAKLLADNDAGLTALDYQVTIAAAPDELVGRLANGELDIAALPTNLAATLYNKSGDVQILALNTLGVLYILERGETVEAVSDLAGRTIYATGQGANPEYVLAHILRENGLEPGTDVTIEWKASDELAALMAAGEVDLCMLPVPAATGVLMKNQEVRTALDLTAEWNALGGEGVLTMGCVVARTDFVRAHPELVDLFLAEYEASIAYLTEHQEEGAALIAAHEITPNATIAEAALPQANLIFISGAAVRDEIQAYYQVLFAANPTSIGGFIPDDAFYYIP